MTPCPRCHRHLRDTESSCPFCAASLPSAPQSSAGLPATVIKVTAVLLTPLVLAACYGPPRGAMPHEGGAGTAPSGSAPTPDAGKP